MNAQTLPLGGHASQLAVRAALAAAAAILALVLLFAVAGGQGSVPPAGGGAVNTTAIPAAYVPWVRAAGSMCAAISPAVIAAQDQVESNWNPDIRNSTSGADGIAQFLPSTFASWGRDDDGTGNVSPFNPHDAIMAQGRYDCSLASLARQLLSSGQVTGTVTDLALASYNAGPGQVEAAHGVPADAADYVKQIDSLAASTYSAAAAAGSAAGLAAVSAAESALGTRTSGAGRAPTRTAPTLRLGATARHWSRWPGAPPGSSCRGPRSSRSMQGRPSRQ